MLRVFFAQGLFGLLLLIFLLPGSIQAAEKNSPSTSGEGNSLAMINQAIGAWLGILTNQGNEIDMSIFSKNPKLNLLETEAESTAMERISRRKKKFMDGEYTIKSISDITRKNKSITFKLILDWKKFDKKEMTDSARIEEVIIIEYPSSKKDEIIIDSISEEYGLPSDSLATKLKC